MLSHLNQLSCPVSYASAFYVCFLVLMDVQTPYRVASTSMSRNLTFYRCSFWGIFKANLVIIIHSFSDFEPQDNRFEQNGYQIRVQHARWHLIRPSCVKIIRGHLISLAQGGLWLPFHFWSFLRCFGIMLATVLSKDFRVIKRIGTKIYIYSDILVPLRYVRTFVGESLNQASNTLKKHKYELRILRLSFVMMTLRSYNLLSSFWSFVLVDLTASKRLPFSVAVLMVRLDL